MSTDLPIPPQPSVVPDTHANTPVVPRPAGAAYTSAEAAWMGDGAETGSGGIARYLATAARFKWVILFILVAGTAVGYMASRMVKPVYQVQARLWLDRSSGGARGPIQEGQLLDANSWLDLLTSYAVLDYVVLDQRLYLDVDPADAGLFANFSLKERFLPGDYRVRATPDGQELVLDRVSGAVVEKTAAGDSLGRSVGFAWVPAASMLRGGKIVTFKVLRPRDRARDLGGQLSPRLPKNGTFLHLSLRDENPIRATRTLNAVVDRFVGLAAELKRARLQEFATLLDDQLEHARQNLQNAESAFNGFRVETITQPTETPTSVAAGIQATTNPAMTNYMTLKIEQDQFNEDRAAIARALDRSENSAVSTAELEAIGSVQNSSEVRAALNELSTKRANLRALRYRYTDEYVEVKRVLAEIQTLESVTIPALLRDLMNELARRESKVDAELATSSAEMRQIPPRVMEEARLRRQVAIADNLYTMLRQRHEEARLAALSSRPDIRIIDRAVRPQNPLKDPSTFSIIYGFGGSLVLIIAGVVVLEKFDRRVRFPQEVTHGLRLPMLAAIPRLSNANGNGNAANTGQVIEAFRGLRMTVLHERGTTGCFATAITSPGSGDGKSFVSINLAFALAEQGYRTLLIDGDIRRGGLHHFAGLTRKPGLTDYLAGTAKREEVIQRTAYPMLDVVASGKRMQSGPELLGSPALQEFVRDVRSQYAVVLIDTPPLGAGVDACLLGMAAGNLVLILRTGLTDLEFTEAKLSVIDRLPVRLWGAILNGVPSGGAYRYYGYIGGYEPQDEDASRLPVLS